MKSHLRTLLCLMAVLGILTAPAAFAQGVTTGAISGAVLDQQGGALPGAQVEAVFGPTGTRYSAVAGDDGRYRFLNVRVGGPYTVTATMDGFRAQKAENVDVALGKETQLEFKLQLETVSETVVVVGESSALINSSRTGAASNVYQEAIETLPTVNRGIEDFARTNPLFNVSSANDQAGFITVAGRNSRYNNIQIDGAVNNDLFGLADSGTPGGQTESQPISLDAVQELQLVISPYDVRQGGFTGGGVNLITKGGSNDFKGSIYGFTRNEDWVGDGASDRPFGAFEENQYGLTFGGPLKSDKVFFFLSGEVTDKETPSGFTSAGGSGDSFNSAVEAARARDVLRNVYGYDPGGLEEFTRITEGDKIFARLDFNLNDRNNLVFRHNFVDAANDIGGPRPSRIDWVFPDRFYNITDETNSTVLQLNSVFGPNAFNEFRIGYQTIRDTRTGDTRFPAINIQLANGDDIFAGTENFSTQNALDQDILEITNDFTFVRGDHTITIGTHNELFKFDNLFIRDSFGTYLFRSVNDLAAGRAFRYDYSFSLTGDPNESANFKVNQLGLYAGDQWQINSNFNVVYGVRFDVPLFPDDPTANPVAEARFGFGTDETADGNLIWSPRIGFNWDITGAGKQQLRGGLGIFGGRTPYVWLSNQYGNTGVEFRRLSLQVSGNNFIPFVANPDAQPRSVGNAATNEINFIDPDFEYPNLWRLNLAYDTELPIWGLTATVEAIYSEVLNDIHYENLNFRQSATAFDGRPTFTRLDPTFSNVILLTNTSLGDTWNAYLKIEKPYSNGLYASVSYAYGNSRSVNDGTSSQAFSNWRFNNTSGGPSEEVLGVSVFDVRHRYNAVLSWKKEFFTNAATSVGLFYNLESGRPYATTFTRDMNGDLETNDLFYVPRSADEVVIEGGTWEQLDAYIKADKGLEGARGTIVSRNASRAPWRHDIDLAIAQEIPFGGSRFKAELTFDILNVANLIDKEKGLKKYAPFNEISPIDFRGLQAGTNKPIYRLQSVVTNPDLKFTTDDLRSRWQGKIGIRLRF
jgi:Carboxypeptidase regulatory-like domain/TonB-dependent Receptor Plug Domain